MSRHDKWLCMMYPRLKLLQKLMSDEGVVFISIDTNELYNLKSICDEIFGTNCFVSDISWQRVYCPRNDSKGIPSEIDDFDRRNEICRGLMTTPTPQKAIMLVSDTQDSLERSKQRYDAGSWPMLYFTTGGKGGMRCKKYLCDMPGKVVTNLWHFTEVGHTDEALKELKKIFGGRVVFDTPKPPRLIERILQILGDSNAIVLDSFAGSGTTAHAVLNANKADGGNRRFILIEMEDYTENVTAERVKRVINGYGEGKAKGGCLACSV